MWIRLSISPINIIHRAAIGAELSLEAGRVVSYWGRVVGGPSCLLFVWIDTIMKWRLRRYCNNTIVNKKLHGWHVQSTETTFCRYIRLTYNRIFFTLNSQHRRNQQGYLATSALTSHCLGHWQLMESANRVRSFTTLYGYAFILRCDSTACWFSPQLPVVYWY